MMWLLIKKTHTTIDTVIDLSQHQNSNENDGQSHYFTTRHEQTLLQAQIDIFNHLSRIREVEIKNKHLKNWGSTDGKTDYHQAADTLIIIFQPFGMETSPDLSLHSHLCSTLVSSLFLP